MEYVWSEEVMKELLKQARSQQTTIQTSREDSASSRRDTISEIGEEERFRAEPPRVVERKERVRELQRLKEEERLAKIEEELRQQIWANA